MSYPDAAWERAMTVQEVMLKALSGELHWFRAAEILGWSPRTLRRWRERYETHGYAGLIDKRLHRPSKRRAPAGQVEHILRLYRTRYGGFNVRHFHQIAQRAHGVTVSYSFVKQVLQAAGCVKKHRARGRHRLRREPRACFGEMLHLDGSVHAWFTGVDVRPCLIAVSDDATKRVLHAAFYASESTRGHTAPTYLSADHDPLYRFYLWKANLRILDVQEIKTVPCVPLSHPFVERLIGTVRRECLDRVLFWTAADLEMKLLEFQRYYNGHRTHAGLEGRTPEPCAGSARASLCEYRWQPHCRGLYQTPRAA